MTDKVWPEVLYSFQLRKNILLIHKWEGGKEPTDQMTITNRGRGACNCLGSMRNPMCKHKQMWARLSRLNIPLLGSYYDYDHDILYTPEDGEGVPLQGAVDIWELAIKEGLAY